MNYFFPCLPYYNMPVQQPGIGNQGSYLSPNYPSGTNIVPGYIPSQEGPTTVQDVGYIQEYLQRHIGKKAKFEFLVGTNIYLDKTGTIKEVGNNYVVIIETETDDLLMADLYSVKFVTIYE